MAQKNWAISTVATAPSPATSGTSLIVASGEGARMPSVPFPATIWPAGAVPTPTNAEVVQVTAVSTDTLTIVRARESSTARTVVVGDQIAATLTAGMWDRAVPEISVEAYGAVGDGSTDDAAAIQAAIDAAPAGGADIVLQAKVYRVATGLTILDKPNVRLIGAGAVHDIYGASPTAGTVIKWSGTAGGTLLTIGASAAADAVPGNGSVGMTLDGYSGTNSVATTFKLQSAWFGEYRDLHLRDGSSVVWDLTTVNLSGVEDTQGNIFEQITVKATQTPAAKGIRWSSHATGGGNVSMNHFEDVLVYHDDGTAVECGDSDSNRWIGLWINRAGGGTGLGMDLLGSGTGSAGHCRDNSWYYVQPGPGGVTSRGTNHGYTQPAVNNTIADYSLGNSSADATLGTGSTLWYNTTTGAPRALPNNVYQRGRNAAGNADVDLWRINATGNEFEVNASARLNGGVTIGNGTNLSFSTSTGSMLATGSTQKIAFWGATPIVQPANTTDLRTLLINAGLLATGGASPLNLNGGTLTAGAASVSGAGSFAGALTLNGTLTNSPALIFSPTLRTSAAFNSLLGGTAVIIPTTAGVAQTYGLLFTPQVRDDASVSNNLTGPIAGVYARVDGGAAYTGTITDARGIVSGAPNRQGGTASWTTYYGFYCEQITGTAGVGTGYAYYAAGSTTPSRFGPVVAAGNLTAESDGTLDIGASGSNRFRDLFLTRNLAVGLGLRVGTSTTIGYVLTADASGNATWQTPPSVPRYAMFAKFNPSR